MKARVLLVLSIVAFAVAGATAPAQATHVVDEWSVKTTHCTFQGVQTCSVTSTHRVWADGSNPNFCIGSAGSYTSCRMWHYCWLDGSGGPFMSASLSCNFATPGLLSCVQTTVGACNGGVTVGSTWVAVGTCVDFRVDTQASAAAGTTTHFDIITGCVDAWGPYVI